MVVERTSEGRLEVVRGKRKKFEELCRRKGERVGRSDDRKNIRKDERKLFHLAEMRQHNGYPTLSSLDPALSPRHVIAEGGHVLVEGLEDNVALFIYWI
jgi:hypothetical protein